MIMETTTRHRLYIGENNETNQVDYVLLRNILSRHFQGYTQLHADGVWEGETEESVVIELIGERREDVLKAVKELRVELEQEAIFVTEDSVQAVLVTE